MDSHATRNNDAYLRELNRLRARIAAIPVQYHEELLAKADEAERQYLEMRRTKESWAEVDAEIRLQAEYLAFSVTACRREVMARCPNAKCPF